jgi:transposase
MSPTPKTFLREGGVGRTSMSLKELKRAEVLARVRAHTLSLRDASTLMGLSYRQTRRVWKRFRRGGAIALRHRSAGRRSPHRKRAAFKHRVLTLIRRHFLGDEHHEPFGPTLIAEHLLEEYQLHVDAETVRRWMLAQGLWRRSRQAPKHRRRRECKAHFGELVQLDGSFETWLEDRGPQGCLMDMVDDATNRVGLRFEPQETIWGAVRSLRAWIEHYGIPQALYTDWKNVYVRKPTEAELATDEPARTQFGRMCARLGIRIIAASSPQAKGRVERGNGTHQDRLVKKLRRVGIADYDTANQFLERSYVPGHTARFSRPPVSPDDFHTPVPPGVDLDQVFRLETTRTVTHDWVVRYDNRLLQLERQGRFYPPAHSAVVVCEYEDGHLEIWYRERRVAWTEITGTARRPTVPQDNRTTSPSDSGRRLPARRRPAADHPWRRGYEGLHDGVSPGEAIPGHPGRPVLLAASAGPARGRGACSAASSSTSI